MKNKKLVIRKKIISPLTVFIYGLAGIAVWFVLVLNGLRNLFSNGNFLCTSGNGAHGDFPNCPTPPPASSAENIKWWIATLAGWLGVILVVFAISWKIKLLIMKNKSQV